MARIKNPITLVGSGGSVPAKPEESKTVALMMATGNQVVTPSAGKVLTQVTIQKPSTLIPSNIKADVNIGGVTGSYTGSASGSMPTLRTVSISRNGNTLNISNPSSNGTFVTGYKIYDNGTLVATQTSTSYNLFNLSVGTHSITVKAYGTNFNDSAASSAVSYAIYSITNALTDLTSSNSSTRIAIGNAYSATLTAASGKYLPNSITVTVGGEGVKYTYNNETGAVSIQAADITGDIVITAEASPYARLATPTVVLTESILSWTAVENATSYSIRCNGIEVSTTTSLSYDLSTLYTEDGIYPMTVVAQAEGYQDSNSSDKVTYLIGVAPIYGVSGMYGTSTTLTRTDDAVGLGYTINSDGTIISDFNEVFPWNETAVETINGNKFLKFPDMWFRVGKDSSNRITDIAVSRQQGPGTGWYKVDSFYYGCYGGSLSGNILRSVSGVARKYSATRANFRSYAAANGSGYFQLDLYHKMVTTFLWLIEFANKNSQSIMRGVDNGTRRDTGGTNSLTTPSGYNTSTKQMRYHYIEDFIGNYYEFIDGMVWATNKLYVTADPSKFSDTTNGHNLFTPAFLSTTGNCLAAIGWDENNPFLCYGVEAYNDSNYGTGYCDGYFYANSSSIILYSGAAWNNSAAVYGLLCFIRDDASSAYSYIGGRLLYKP